MTLAELILTSTAAAIIITALSATMLIASQALPANANELDGAVNGGLFCEQLADEVLCASTASIVSGERLTLVVPDRDNDGDLETIQYSWSGTAGDPLTRAYNGGTAVSVLENVAELTFDYDVAVETHPGESVAVESAETTLAEYASNYSLGNEPVRDSLWQAQHFTPALPDEAVAWRVNRVALTLATSSFDTGAFYVQLRWADHNGLPTSTVLTQQYVAESSLASYWKTYSISTAGCPDLDPDDSACIVLQHITGVESCRLLYRSGGVSGGTNYRSRSSNQGGSWSVTTGDSWLYAVYGTYTTLEPGPDEVTRKLRGIRLYITFVDSVCQPIELTLPLLNEPEVSG